MSKRTPLSRELFAIVDDEDYDGLAQFNWYATSTRQRGPYAVRECSVGGVKYRFRMHRVILGLDKNNPLQVDHINGDGLDNRRANLRACSNAENHQNMRPRSRALPTGVHYCKSTGRYVANATLRRRYVWLGRHDTPIQAAKAVREFRRLHMPFSQEALEP